MAGEKKQQPLTLFTKLAQNLAEFQGSYRDTVVCALCMKEFGLENVKLLSEDHPVPSKLKGTGPTLTCRSCNNKSGHKLEKHLVNAMRALDGMEGTAPFDATLHGAGGRMLVSMTWGTEKIVPVKMRVIEKGTNPAAIEARRETFQDGRKIDVSVNLKFTREAYWRACIRSAYLTCFELNGYDYVFSAGAKQVRDVLDGNTPVPTSLVMEAFPEQDPQSERVMMPTSLSDVGAFYSVMLRLISKRTRYVNVLLPGNAGADWNLLSQLGAYADRLRIETVPLGWNEPLFIPMGPDPITNMRPRRWDEKALAP